MGHIHSLLVYLWPRVRSLTSCVHLASIVIQIKVGTFSKPRQRRKREGDKAKDLMGRTRTPLVRFENLYETTT